MSHEALSLLVALLPELALLAGGAAIVVLLPRDSGGGRNVGAARIALAAVALAVVLMHLGFELPAGPEGLARGPSAIRIDFAATAARWAALFLGVLLIGANYSLPESRPSTSLSPGPSTSPGAGPGRYAGDRASPEFFMLLLFSLAGLMLTAAANDIIVLFLALELTSVPTIVAVALSRPHPGATEAGGKYFFLSALSAGLLLMGFAYLFGATGYTNLDQVMFALHGRTTAVTLVAMGLLLAGLSFKIAAFPFHVYLADIYQGAAAPVAGWLSFVPKAAGLLALGKLLATVGGPASPTMTGWLREPVWQYAVGALAVATMTAGNVLALWQRNVKRLLAYSSVAHSGYLLVALLAVPEPPAPGGVIERATGQPPSHSVALVLVFYLVAYGLANLGAFLVLSVVRKPDPGGGTREAETFDDLRGLARTNPPLAIALAIFAFALMGLPPTVGFLAKVFVFVEVFKAGYVWVVVIALVNAAVGAAYYLRIIGACWIADRADPGEDEGAKGREGERATGREGEGATSPVIFFSPSPARAVAPAAGRPVGPAPEAGPPGLVIALLAIATVAFGLFPAGIYQRLTYQTHARWRWSAPPGPPPGAGPVRPPPGRPTGTQPAGRE